MTVNNEKKQKPAGRDYQSGVTEGNLPGYREEQSNKKDTLKSEEIRYKNADKIYE
ncbi:hypothetical protein ACFSCZ_13415 [Siminovitchia sediminis]|uniref:Uncharacterized protein n=1 Tax=Siminovitchia sediminis TaxID=1274353 RepID=A0ABW4KI79_9BACI